LQTAIVRWPFLKKVNFNHSAGHVHSSKHDVSVRCICLSVPSAYTESDSPGATPDTASIRPGPLSETSTITVITSPMEVLRSTAMSMCVCLSSVHLHNLKTTRPSFTNVFMLLPLAVAWSTSDSIAIRYLLLVLWMT